MDSDFFDNFTHSVAAARLLLEKAHDQANFIEGLVLYASSVDAILRNLVALKSGAKQKDGISLDPRYFYHDDSKWMNERNIYREALDYSVITQDEFQELERLYAFRNVVIHRFIISNISYAQIAPELIKYEIIFKKLFDQLKEIEQPEKMTNKERGEANQRITKKIVGT